MRLFDWDLRYGQPGDRGPLTPGGRKENRGTEGASRLELVPTVYVTTAVLGYWAEQYRKDPALARRFAADLIQKWKPAAVQVLQRKDFRTIQIDADWNAGTRESYFAVLTEIKKTLAGEKIRLSVTVRLHQYRDRETQGIPPADEGVLMVYGASDPSVMTTEKTVLDLSLVRSYLKGPAYPFPLSAGVPLYAQTRQFNPYGRFVVQVRTPLFTDPSQFPQDFQPAAENPGWWEALHRRDWYGALVMEHDLVRADGVSSADLEALKGLIREKMPRDRLGLVPGTVFFDYDREEWKRSDHEKLRRIFEGF